MTEKDYAELGPADMPRLSSPGDIGTIESCSECMDSAVDIWKIMCPRCQDDKTLTITHCNHHMLGVSRRGVCSSGDDRCGSEFTVELRDTGDYPELLVQGWEYEGPSLWDEYLERIKKATS